MDPLTIGLIAGGGLGLGKWLLHDRPAEEASRKQRAAEIRYSPWTRMAPSTQIQDANLMGDVMQGGAAGATMGQSVSNWELSNALKNKILNQGSLTPVSVSAAPSYYSPWTLA